MRGTVRGRGAGGGLALTFFTSRQTWWPWMERLYREAQEPTRSTTATDQAGVRGNDISGEQENCIYILAKKKENSPT